MAFSLLLSSVSRLSFSLTSAAATAAASGRMRRRSLFSLKNMVLAATDRQAVFAVVSHVSMGRDDILCTRCQSGCTSRAKLPLNYEAG